MYGCNILLVCREEQDELNKQLEAARKLDDDLKVQLQGVIGEAVILPLLFTVCWNTLVIFWLSPTPHSALCVCKCLCGFFFSTVCVWTQGLFERLTVGLKIRSFLGCLLLSSVQQILPISVMQWVCKWLCWSVHVLFLCATTVSSLFSLST